MEMDDYHQDHIIHHHHHRHDCNNNIITVASSSSSSSLRHGLRLHLHQVVHLFHPRDSNPSTSPSTSPASIPSFSPSTNPSNIPSVDPHDVTFHNRRVLVQVLFHQQIPLKNPTRYPLNQTRNPAKNPTRNPTFTPSVSPSFISICFIKEVCVVCTGSVRFGVDIRCIDIGSRSQSPRFPIKCCSS